MADANRPKEAQAPATLSQVMIILNDERNLPRCLASVAGLARQGLVLEARSEDRTQGDRRRGRVPFRAQPFVG